MVLKVFADNLSSFCHSFWGVLKRREKSLWRMPRTLQNQRFWAVGMLKSGMSATVKQFGVSWQTASLWLHCCQMTRNVSDLPCSGSPRMLHHCLWSKFQPEQLALSLDWEECVLILSRTIWVSKVYTHDVLLIVQLSSLVTMLCNLPRHHLYLRNAQWYRVAFTDECSISFLGADGCQSLSMATRASCFQEHVCHGSGRIMVWGGISTNHWTDLVA